MRQIVAQKQTERKKKQIERAIEDWEIKKWMEMNTFECSLGRVTPEMCEQLRKRPSLSEIINKKFSIKALPDGTVLPDGTYLTKPAVCEQCKDWEKLAKQVYERRKRNQVCAVCKKPIKQSKNALIVKGIYFHRGCYYRHKQVKCAYCRCKNRILKGELVIDEGWFCENCGKFNQINIEGV